MTLDEFPAELLKFVAAQIDSVEQILILQLLHENPSRAWTISDLTSELRSANTSVEMRLQDFYGKGILLPPGEDSSGQHSFRPATQKMRESIELLLKNFRERPHRLVALIYSESSKPKKAFADAFNFRKEEDE